MWQSVNIEEYNNIQQTLSLPLYMGGVYITTEMTLHLSMWLTFCALCEKSLQMYLYGLVWPFEILSSSVRRVCQSTYWCWNVARNEVDLNPIFGLEWSPAAFSQYQLNSLKSSWATASKQTYKRKILFVFEATNIRGSPEK